MRIPNTIKIGPYIYEIKIESEAFLSDDKVQILCGQCDLGGQTIRIIQQHPDQMYQTLWHEVLHGINDFMGTNLDEETVERLAHGLVMVLLDNGMVKRPEIASQDT